jgi:ketosteroid isomerase-like protein
MSSKAENSAKDEELIRGVISEMTEGFNKHDARAASQMYTVDADSLRSVENERKGRASLKGSLRQFSQHERRKRPREPLR